MTEVVKILFIDWCAKEALEGTQMLEPLEELAYRRILDFIYSTNDRLPDDDKRLARITKTGRQWKTIKQTLIEFQKIEVENGFIRNKKCTSKLAQSRKNIEQKSAAGKASAQKRNALKNNETAPTAADTSEQSAEHTAAPTAEATNHEPIKKKKINKKRKSASLPQSDDVPPDKQNTAPKPRYDHPLWFEGKVIRLNERDFNIFQNLHGGGNTAFMDYLLARDEWYFRQAPSKQKSWFMATKNDLSNNEKQENPIHA